MNVRIRGATASDAAWLDSWLPSIPVFELLGLNQGGCASLLTGRGRHVRIIEHGDPVGIVVARTSGPRSSSAIIELVATPAANARRGVGVAAVELFEQELLAMGVRRVYAPAPEAHGIAMYFWIRLGYRPLLRGDWPCERDGVAWLRREI